MQLQELRKKVAQADLEEIQAEEALREARLRLTKARENTKKTESEFPKTFTMKLSECTINGRLSLSPTALRDKLLRDA